MAEGLQTLEGEAIPLDSVKIDKDFAAAMAAPVEDVPAPPKRPETLNDDKQSRPKRAPKAARSRVQAPKATQAKTSPELDAQRSDGIKGLVQMAAVGCLMMDGKTPDDNIAFKADAVTLANSADALASACVETAKANPGFARIVDKVTQAGPYAALVSVTLSIGAQLARNHGVKAGEMLGARPPESVLQDLEQESPSDADAAA